MSLGDPRLCVGCNGPLAHAARSPRCPHCGGLLCSLCQELGIHELGCAEELDREPPTDEFLG